MENEIQSRASKIYDDVQYIKKCAPNMLQSELVAVIERASVALQLSVTEDIEMK